MVWTNMYEKMANKTVKSLFLIMIYILTTKYLNFTFINSKENRDIETIETQSTNWSSNNQSKRLYTEIIKGIQSNHI